MSNSIQTLEEEHKASNQNPNNNCYSDQSQEWVTMARSWLSTFPEGKTVTMSEFEAWFHSNHASLPEDVKSIPRSEIYQRLMSIQNSMVLLNQEKEVNQIDLPQARFQRTDQWIPVYSWLESLDNDDVVKSKDISDWLTDNPNVKEQLCSRHSRYHLMHYIKKCHLKILKRREKKKGLPQSVKASPVKVHKSVMTKQSVPVPSNALRNSLRNLPKDEDAYLAKRNEAFRKYEILVELENQLSTIFAKHQNVQSSKES